MNQSQENYHDSGWIVANTMNNNFICVTNFLILLIIFQAPKVSRMSSMKGLGQTLGSSTGQWQQIVRILDNYMTILKSNYVCIEAIN